MSIHTESKDKSRFLASIILSLIFLFALGFLLPPLTGAADENPVLSAMNKELNRCFTTFSKEQPAPLYFLSYQITDTERTTLSASYGAIKEDSQNHSRYLDADIRVGNPKLDNTHEIRGEYDYSRYYRKPVRISLTDDEQAIRQRLWLETERKFTDAQERYTKVLTNKAVKVEEEDPSDDFSKEQKETFIGERVSIKFDTAPWKDKLKKFSIAFKKYPEIFQSSVGLDVQSIHKYLVNSEGTRIQQGNNYIRLSFYCQTKAEDGMELYRYEGFDADRLEDLPSDEVIQQTIERLIGELMDLREAPLVEPYSGPAILLNRATGVFFHEIFGHRIEGHRQKSETEGQTFTKKVNQEVLPEFISVYDDPTMKDFNGKFLRGFYKYDDEGVKSQRVPVVEKGVLKNFLMSRSPIENFPQSNGHGRRSYSHPVVSRQGNLMIMSEKTVPYSELRKLLIEECIRQDKPYGLIFKDISGGFTSTGRRGPQSFKVIPLLVYRVYTDGRPDEVVRGVDIVGTPLTSFSKIMITGDDYDLFNGTCGAESGWVPVSAVSPSILVSEIEVEKKFKEQNRPPVLPSPGHESSPQSLQEFSLEPSAESDHDLNHDPQRNSAFLFQYPPSELIEAAAQQNSPSQERALEDPVFGAMLDELERTKEKLKMENLDKPYYVEYTVTDFERFELDASFGTTNRKHEDRDRYLMVDLRVGDYSFDNTNFIGDWRGTRQNRNPLPIEDDYFALRQEIWLATDQAYKAALEQFAKKKAYVQTKTITDLPEDLSREDPIMLIEPRVELKVDKSYWENQVKELSAILKDYPRINDSEVKFKAVAVNRYFITNEQFVNRKGYIIFTLEVAVSTQAEDGQNIFNFETFYARSLQDLPARAVLAEKIRNLARTTLELGKAEQPSEYFGPVILTEQASGEFFRQLFAKNVSSPRTPLLADDRFSSMVQKAKLPRKLNRRILPAFMDVVDDPRVDHWNGSPLIGSYQVDDDGIPSQEVCLVENGKLLNYLMCRIPTEKIKKSNGHARGSLFAPANARASNMIFTIEESAQEDAMGKMSFQDLKKKLIEYCKDIGIEYGIIITKLRDRNFYMDTDEDTELTPVQRKADLTFPIEAYKVYVEDGREELIRGMEFEEASVRALKDIIYSGGDHYVHNYLMGN
jgi:predicted Zn-dependent protease